MRPISKLKSKYPDLLYNYWSFISITRVSSKLPMKYEELITAENILVSKYIKMIPKCVQYFEDQPVI